MVDPSSAMSTRPLHELRDEARSARTRGDLPRARAALLAALQHTVAREEDYVGATVQLRDVLAEGGDYRGALTLDWYVSDDRSQRQLVGRVRGHRPGPHLPRLGRPGRRPRPRAQHLRPGPPTKVTSRRASSPRPPSPASAAATSPAPAPSGRASRTCSPRRDPISTPPAWPASTWRAPRGPRATRPRRARRWWPPCTCSKRPADRYETIGQRERALADWLPGAHRRGARRPRVRARAPRATCNVIRILREDHLRYYALQSYEEAVGAAEKQGEVSAAATLAREMSTYARKEGLGAVSRASPPSPRRARPLARGGRRLAASAAPLRRSPRATRSSPRSSPWARPASTARWAASTAALSELRPRRERAHQALLARATGRATRPPRTWPSTPPRCPRTCATRSASPRCGTSIWWSGSRAAAPTRGLRRHRPEPQRVVRGHPPAGHAGAPPRPSPSSRPSPRGSRPPPRSARPRPRPGSTSPSSSR